MEIRSSRAAVVRISPVVEASSGTIKVTLEASPDGKLRPGMFASVALELEARDQALIIPKVALALDSIGDTVFVEVDGEAQRRTIEIGYRDGNRLEVLSGLEEGDQVVVMGQDGLADGTPVQILAAEDLSETESAQVADSGEPSGSGGRRGGRSSRLRWRRDDTRTTGADQGENALSRADRGGDCGADQELQRGLWTARAAWRGEGVSAKEMARNHRVTAPNRAPATEGTDLENR